MNDAGTALLSGTKLPSETALANRQCTVQLYGTIKSVDAQTLSLFLNIRFSSSFTGTRNFFLAARDGNGNNNTGWQQAGTWTVQ